MGHLPGTAQEKMRLGVRGLRVQKAASTSSVPRTSPISHMPDYAVSFDGDIVRFTNRSTMKPLPSPGSAADSRSSTPKPTMTPARSLPAMTCIIWNEQWRNFWYESGQPELNNPDAAFIGFCRSRHAQETESLKPAQAMRLSPFLAKRSLIASTSSS